MVTVFVDVLKSLAKISSVGGRLGVVDVIESDRLLRSAKLFNVNATAVSPPLALLEGAVEPDHSVDTTLDHHLGRLFFPRWLHEQEGLFHLVVSLDRLEFLSRLVATECLFEQLGL